MEEVLTRAQVDEKYTWDLTNIFESDEAFEKAFSENEAQIAVCAGYAGKICEGKDTVLEALKAYMPACRTLSSLCSYAMMKQDEDASVARYQAMRDRAMSLASRLDAACAYLTPELLALPESELEEMISDPAFADLDVFLKGILREKPHTLTTAEERLLAKAGEVMRVPEGVYDMLTVNMDFGKTRGEDGNKTPLTDVRLTTLLSSPDRAVRKQAYCGIMNGYKRFGDTIAAVYAGQIKADMFSSDVRHYESARAASLYPDEIPESVYDSLIDAVHGGLGTLKAYLEIRRRELGLARLHLYDLYARSPQSFEIKPDIEEAFDTFLRSVEPLGEDYVRDASVALKERWMDVYETKGKRSGAYSSGGVTESHPHILLNHKKNYDGLSTLCHEMGHAMHSFYSNRTQPFEKADYTLFVAEVASTTNEILLAEYLRKQYAGDRDAQIMLIGSLLEHFRTTVFRQTMFAEFEQKAHRMAEQGEALTCESLSEMYYGLNKLYYGGSCRVDREVASEWMRIPHFYSPFYVYKYATGFCAAVALSRNILSGDSEKVAAYRRFLTLGGSLPPIEELKIAGVDMSSPQPVCEALDYFAELVMDYDALLSQEKD